LPLRHPATRQHAKRVAYATACRRLVVAGALAALPLAGCSLGLTDLPAIPHHVDDDPPLARTYRSNLASALQKPGAIFQKPDRAGPFEISEPRHTLHLTGRAWLVCLKTEAWRQPVTYALFMKGNRVVDYRAAVWTDRCDEQTYESLVMN